MSKFELIVRTDNASEIALIVAALNGTATTQNVRYNTAPQPEPINVAAPNPPAANAEPDEGPVNSAAPAVDSAGLPWDERIHARTKAIVNDGTWRKRRGVDDNLVRQVEAELRARAVTMPRPEPMFTDPAPQIQQPQAAFIPDPAAVAAQANQQPGNSMPDPAAIAAAQQVSTAAPVSAVPPTSPVPAASTGAIDFGSFMNAVSAGMKAGKIDAQYLANLAASLGVPAVTALGATPDKLAAAYLQLQIDGKI